jgi:hypothetical protein
MSKGGAGKRKGSGFERKICVALSRWVTKGKRRDCFWRSAMSGGRATVIGHQHIRQAGDICAVAPEGVPFIETFVVECKAYKDIDLEAFIVSNKGKISKWWKKVKSEATQQGRVPMLIAKQNLTPVLVFLPTKFMKSHRTANQTAIILFNDLIKMDAEQFLRRETKPLRRR